MKKPMTFALFLLVTVASCVQTASQTTGAKRYDGRTLFRGLVFFEGDVSNNIKLLNDARRVNRIDSLNKYQMILWNNYKEYTTRFIDKYHPGFFVKFGTMIQSGNPVLVDAALRSAGDLVLESWALKPLMILTRPDLKDLTLSPKTQAALARLSAAKTIEEVRQTIRAADFAKDLIIYEARALDIDVRLDNQVAIDRYANLDYFIFHDLDYAISADAFRQRSTNLNLNAQVQRLISYNRNFALQFDKDIDLGAGSWFNENEWLNENRYVNNNENFNVDKNVNVKEDVSVFVEVVIFATVGFERIAGLDPKEQFLREELVKSVTENFATGARTQ